MHLKAQLKAQEAEASLRPMVGARKEARRRFGKMGTAPLWLEVVASGPAEVNLGEHMRAGQ